MKRMDAKDVIRLTGSRDPFRAAARLEIPVHHLYHERSGLPGLCCIVKGRPSVFINDAFFAGNFDEDGGNAEDDMRQIAAHELGHCLLHKREMELAPIAERSVFDGRSRMEREANAFAAELLIDGEELREMLLGGASLMQASAYFRVSTDLLIVAAERLCPGCRLPYIPQSSFMRRVGRQG
ncbi:MAG: ImmA/IrrE family metallo-endopeptidase [Oscillospiraceae bacterium]|nr:ImmA/IrrE family metallo-endopeptidase [Oscillospiraceae bacterium]